MSQYPPRKLPDRLRWHVVRRGYVFRWAVVRDGVLVRSFLFKYQAVDFAAAQALYEWETLGTRSELYVYTSKHRLDDRLPYGDDPRQPKG